MNEISQAEWREVIAGIDADGPGTRRRITILAIRSLHQRGHTYAEIGRALDLSGSRIGQLARYPDEGA